MSVLTIFDRLEKCHIKKDVIEFPLAISKKNNDRLTCLYSSEEVISSEDNVEYIKTKNIPIISNLFNLSNIIYLISNSLNHSFLILIHLRYYNLIYGLIYKIINPSGVLIYKLDHGDIQLMDQGVFYGNKYKVFFEKKLFQLLKKRIDLICCETKKSENFFKEKTGFIKSIVVRNSINNNWLIKSNGDRKNKFLVIGRLSDENKNIDFILNALKEIDLKSWSCDFIGEYDISFKKKVESLKNDKINLIGVIEDRKKLMEIISTSRVLLLSSIHEGSPLVFSEACINGLIICSTRVSAVEEYVEKYGYVIEQNDLKSYIKAIECIVEKDDRELDSIHKEIMKDYNDLTWDKAANKVLSSLDV